MKAAGFFRALIVLSALGVGALQGEAAAATAKEIDVSSDVALDRLYSEVPGSKEVVKDAKGVLVFPSVIKAGIGIGGEYGEGALRINGKTVDYYNTAAGSFGFQLGAQKKSIVLLFMTDEALTRFRTSTGWKAGVDASVAVVAVGAGGAVDTAKYHQPVLAFIIGQKGLMYNLTLEGAKMTKIQR